MLGESGVAENTLPARRLSEPGPVVFEPGWRTPDGLAGWLHRVPWPICLITLVALVLRFAELSGVSPNQFYDAAVRSMTMSLHNFFYGAFDPGSTLAIDKPPLDLWLQVLSVKLFGWGPFALKLPEALGGTLAVPLLYDTVRRAVGRPAALAAAAALAVFPESVLTSRSETMDSVMMLLVIAALWAVVMAVQSDSTRWIVLAGVAMGLAFNVKLLEPLVAAPALVVLYLLASHRRVRRKLRDLALTGAAMAGVGLSWAVAVSLSPGRHPWAVGSTDGSVWNAMFVFNGFGKASQTASTKPGGPGPFRLVVSTGWHYDVLFGCVLVAAVALGVAAAVTALRGGRVSRRASRIGLPGAFGIAVGVWMLFGVLVFDTMQTVHARYLEALAPALAIAIGFGAAALAGLRDPERSPSLAATMIALLVICAYTFSLHPAKLAWGAAALVCAAAGAALLARSPGRAGFAARWLTAALIVASAMTFPVHETLLLVHSKANDSLGLATTSSANATALSRYLMPRTSGIRYELAADEPLGMAPLIIRDRRAILPLTSWAGQPLVGLTELLADVRAGRVRYGLAARYRCTARTRSWAACTPAARWIRRHGIDVTPAVGLSGSDRLYLLPGRAA